MATDIPAPSRPEPKEADVQPVLEFLKGVMNDARRQKNADRELLDILERHLLTEKPHKDAVARAVSAINELAETRAAKRTRGSKEK